MNRDRLSISDPVVVGRSKANETRWGYFQFPSLFRLPDGELMVSVNNADDAISAYGSPVRRFASSDQGRTWREAGATLPLASPHPTCAELFEGDYLILAPSAPLNLASAGIALPPPAGEAFAYRRLQYYRVDQCPAPLQRYLTRLPAWRWTPAQPVWTAGEVRYEIEGQLCLAEGPTEVPRTWFEHAPIRHGNELLYVDYRVNCLKNDGSVPDGFSCVLMVSRDNGRSFKKRSVVATGRVYEPVLADTACGELVCIVRGADQEQRPLLITYSRDHGLTWEPPRALFPYGVFPALVRMGNGVLLLAFGRPGVWISASLDGSGRTWTEPEPALEDDGCSLLADTCGYTGLLPVSRDEALLVYSNFKARGTDGQACKSVEVRRIVVPNG